MTPEERGAHAIPPTYTDWNYEDLLQHVADAIRQAIEAEREACSRLAAVMGMPRQNDESAFGAREQTEARLVARIAAGLQARTNKS